MKTSKFLTFSLILAAAMGLAALPTFATPYWAAVYSGAYDKDKTLTTESRANYTAYYCTVEAAQAMFGTADRDGIEAYLSDADNFAAGKAAMGTTAGSTALTTGEYGLGQYSFVEYSASAIADGSYLAVLFYQNEGYRVFDVFDTDLLTSGDLLFTDKSVAQGDWMTVEQVPEPTSAMLLLFGLAGLALKRKCA